MDRDAPLIARRKVYWRSNIVPISNHELCRSCGLVLSTQLLALPWDPHERREVRAQGKPSA